MYSAGLIILIGIAYNKGNLIIVIDYNIHIVFDIVETCHSCHTIFQLVPAYVAYQTLLINTSMFFFVYYIGNLMPFYEIAPKTLSIILVFLFVFQFRISREYPQPK